MPSNEKLDKKLADAIVRYSQCYPQITTRAQTASLHSWGISAGAEKLLTQNPNAVLYGALFDYLVPWKQAWEAPYLLKSRLGHLDPNRFAMMSPSFLAPYLQRGSHGLALHRFPPTLSKRIINASKRLVHYYRSDATNIWPNGAPAIIVTRRLEEFEGISQKISRMMVRLLGTYFGVMLTGWDKIDLPVDRHVARLFLRTGLVRRHSGAYSVSDVRNEIIQTARKLMPQFPGSLDEGAFEIGAEWCTNEKAYCDYQSEPCPLSKFCRRKLDIKIK